MRKRRNPGFWQHPHVVPLCRELSPLAYKLFGVLGTYARNANGLVGDPLLGISQALLAEHLGCPREKVPRLVRELEYHGFVLVVPRPGKASLYYLPVDQEESRCLFAPEAAGRVRDQPDLYALVPPRP